MNWYIKTKNASAKDNKLEQAQYLIEKIEEAIDQSMIGGEETIKLLDQLIDRLEGAHGFRSLIPPSTASSILDLLKKARDVKKDSPQKCSYFLEEALTFLY